MAKYSPYRGLPPRKSRWPKTTKRGRQTWGVLASASLGYVAYNFLKGRRTQTPPTAPINTSIESVELAQATPAGFATDTVTFPMWSPTNMEATSNLALQNERLSLSITFRDKGPNHRISVTPNDMGELKQVATGNSMGVATVDFPQTSVSEILNASAGPVVFTIVADGDPYATYMVRTPIGA